MYYFLAEDSENCTSSAVRAVESSAASFSDIPASVLSRLNLTARRSCFSDSETESCRSSRSGMTCEPLTESHGEDSSMSCAEGSHVAILVQPVQTMMSTESNVDWTATLVDFGRKCVELSTRFALDVRLLKTHRCFALAGLSESSKTLTQWGMTRLGECLDVANSVRITSENACSSLLPTPTRHNAKEGAYPAEYTRNTPTLAAAIGGKINPDWNEWRMGWPIKWTDLQPLAMVRFLVWLRLHGKPYQQESNSP